MGGRDKERERERESVCVLLKLMKYRDCCIKMMNSLHVHVFIDKPSLGEETWPLISLHELVRQSHSECVSVRH